MDFELQYLKNDFFESRCFRLGGGGRIVEQTLMIRPTSAWGCVVSPHSPQPMPAAAPPKFFFVQKRCFHKLFWVLESHTHNPRNFWGVGLHTPQNFLAPEVCMMTVGGGDGNAKGEELVDVFPSSLVNGDISD